MDERNEKARTGRAKEVCIPYLDNDREPPERDREGWKGEVREGRKKERREGNKGCEAHQIKEKSRLQIKNKSSWRKKEVSRRHKSIKQNEKSDTNTNNP